MKGHQSSIIDLAIHETLEQVFSYDKDGVRIKKAVLKLWASAVKMNESDGLQDKCCLLRQNSIVMLHA